MSGKNSTDEPNGDHVNITLNSGPNSPTQSKAAVANDAPSPPTGPPKQVEDVLYSDIGIVTLLNRLKQSIASAQSFAAFLKKRSSLEEEQATGLKRLAKSQLEASRRQDHKAGSYALQLAEVLKVHERMGDNGMQFALSLHQMNEDLNELGLNMERGRKHWKHEGLDSEKKASDAEQAMQKAKARYDSLAESYDRARTGDTKGSRRLGLKGPKSAEQYESDLLQKVQAADTEYEERVRHAKSQRDHLINTGRPQAIKALQNLVKECDAGVTLQLQKYATFNEKLLLGNGLAVSPLADRDGPASPRSMRDLIYDIDNERDFHSYVGEHYGKLPPRPSEIRYEKHPVLAPKTQQPRNPSLSAASQPPPSSGGLSAGPANSQPSSMNNRYSTQQVPPPQPNFAQPPPQQPSYSSYSSQPPVLPDPVPTYNQSPQTPYSPQAPPSRDTYATPPYPTHPSDRAMSTSPVGNSGYPPTQTTGSIAAAAPQLRQQPPPSALPTSPTHAAKPPSRPVFGLSLEQLFERDQSAVPMVVYQCMQAVDLFGLDIEGIYRLSGTSSHVNQLRAAFDANAGNLDFRNPANFYHDVNSVATLLKQFFRDLPEPLFTSHGYSGFIDAARVEEEGQRRDALHQRINDLPDPNYATLRALVLHLHRVIMNEGRNRMGASNLAICFAPSLMGAHSGPAIADAGLQAIVMDTILNNATAIFDED